MTTAKIITLANGGGLGSGGLDLEVEIRHNVIPAFFADIDGFARRPWWRKQVWSQAVTAGDRDYNLPTDFGYFHKIMTSYGNELVYRGEYDEEVLDSEFQASAGTGAENEPRGYYILPDSAGTPTLESPVLYLSFSPTTAFTMKGVYYRRIHWADDSTSVELNPYIPLQLQYALVERLRMEIVKDRVAQGDKRYDLYKAEYGAWIERIRTTAIQPAQGIRQHLLR